MSSVPVIPPTAGSSEAAAIQDLEIVHIGHGVQKMRIFRPTPFNAFSSSFEGSGFAALVHDFVDTDDAWRAFSCAWQ